MAGLWSNPGEFPRLPDEEEIGGVMNLVGPGGSSGYGVDEDTGMFGPGRSSGFGQIDDDMSNDGLGQAITPFRGGEMQGGLSPSGPISLFGNTRRMGHGDDLSMVMSPNSICRVCEYVVSGLHCPQCTVCNCAVHPDCCTQFGMNVAVCHRCVGERHRQIESCQRAQTTHRDATDLGRSAIRNAEIAGNVLGVSAASTVKAVVVLGRSTVRGMSSVLQRDDEDDKERTEVDADDKHDFESIGADVGEMVQDNSAVSQAIFHQVHTPRQELSTSSKLDGDQNGERNATRTLFSGSVFSGGHKRPRSGTSYASKQFLWTGIFHWKTNFIV